VASVSVEKEEEDEAQVVEVKAVVMVSPEAGTVDERYNISHARCIW
jgi:hypothetical protein